MSEETVRFVLTGALKGKSVALGFKNRWKFKKGVCDIPVDEADAADAILRFYGGSRQGASVSKSSSKDEASEES